MPFRKCVGCNKIKESAEMIKMTRVHDSQDILINPDSRYFGRSSYVCYNKECILNALKKKKLQKSLKTQIQPQIIEQLEKLTGIN